MTQPRYTVVTPQVRVANVVSPQRGAVTVVRDRRSTVVVRGASQNVTRIARSTVVVPQTRVAVVTAPGGQGPAGPAGVGAQEIFEGPSFPALTPDRNALFFRSGQYGDPEIYDLYLRK